MRIATVVGARPQFIKACPVSNEIIAQRHFEYLVHTGQHYDYSMSQVFFEELELRAPYVNLGVGSGSHGWQTGQMLVRVEEVLQSVKPDWVLVYGDTNSTLAGALAACKLGIPLAHIEAGLRSYDRQMPEEHNRILVDHCSDLLFCPTETAVANLTKEGLSSRTRLVGDTMYDLIVRYSGIARERSTILGRLGLSPKKFLLATIHRASNTSSIETLRTIISALLMSDEVIVFPVHPRTREILAREQIGLQSSKLLIIDPIGYLDMLALEQTARLILTDSGGVQKEAYWLGKPCITLRKETEWVETVESGWNILVGTDPAMLIEAIRFHCWPAKPPGLFTVGDSAAKNIVSHLSSGSI